MCSLEMGLVRAPNAVEANYVRRARLGRAYEFSASRETGSLSIGEPDVMRGENERRNTPRR
jgi:hypothetical protein